MRCDKTSKLKVRNNITNIVPTGTISPGFFTLHAAGVGNFPKYLLVKCIFLD